MAAPPAPANANANGNGNANASPKSNAAFYMKSTLWTIVSLTLATKLTNWAMQKEEFIACEAHVNDNSWIGKRYESMRIFDPRFTFHRTEYVPMRDGVELAVDTYMAQYLWDHQDKNTLPTIIYATRHGRGYQVDFPFSMTVQYKEKFMNPRMDPYIKRFITSGFAWVSYDVRGTGASGGAKQHDFSDLDVQDGHDLIDWITKQPWSNGKVAALGHGLDGISALLLAASGHPAMKAITLNGAPIDTFDAAFFPGGVANAKGIKDFGSFTHDTDRQIRWRDVPGFKAKMMMKVFGGNVYRVDEDDAKLKRLVAQHASNPNLTAELAELHFRDDKLPTAGVPLSAFDARRHLDKIAASGVAVHVFGGYYDMAVARSAIQLFQYLTNTLDADTASLFPKLPEGANTDPRRHRLSLGPWSHAGVDNADPFAQSKQKCYWHLDEISRFFDYHLYEKRRDYTNLNNEEPIHYFTLVHNRWKTAVTWPPEYLSEEKFFLGQNQSLERVSAWEGEASLDVAFNPKFEGVTRWDMIGHIFGYRPNYYHDRTPMDTQFVTFLTPELPLMEITGEVVLRVFFSVDQPAVNLVAFLEDVDHTRMFKNENKRPGVTYITEALLNPVHKTLRPDSTVHSFLKKDSRVLKAGEIYEAVLRFQPISYVVKNDHQLRLSIGVASPASFGLSGEQQPTKLTVHFGGDHASTLTLPTYDGVFTSNVVPPEEEEEGEEATRTEAAAQEEGADEDEFSEKAEEEKKNAKEEL